MLFVNGKIKEGQKEKYSGVPVKGNGCETEETGGGAMASNNRFLIAWWKN